MGGAQFELPVLFVSHILILTFFIMIFVALGGYHLNFVYFSDGSSTTPNIVSSL